jgi:hypothetical protein
MPVGMTQPPTGILVIGAHRSGTSAIARTLGLMGAAEASRLLAPNDGNPSGYWEAEALVAANDRFLAAIGSRWDDPRLLPAAAFAGPAARAARAEIAALAKREFAGRSLFVLKDPRLCRTAPLALAALADVGAWPQVVLPLRAPTPAVRSLMARDGYAEMRCIAIWLGAVLAAERQTRGVHRVFVSYERFQRDPAAGATAMAGELGGFDTADVARAAGVVAEHWAAAGARSPPAALTPGPLATLAEDVHAILRSADGGQPDPAGLDAASARFRALLRTVAYRRAALGDGLRELAGRVAKRVRGPVSS